MLSHFTLALDELLDVCVQNRLIDRYHCAGAVVVIEQETYVHELTPEQAHLYLQCLVRYARGNPGRACCLEAPRGLVRYARGNLELHLPPDGARPTPLAAPHVRFTS